MEDEEEAEVAKETITLIAIENRVENVGLRLAVIDAGHCFTSSSIAGVSY